MAETKGGTKTAEERRPMIPKDVDPTDYVTVRNGFQGLLVYESSRTGEVFKWENFGDEQDMELRELKNAKNSSKKFFEQNWFMFDEDWIVEYLGVSRYYRNAIKIEDFDSLFQLKPDALRKRLEGTSEGQKRSIAYRARTLIADGKIDSLKVVETLEDCLGMQLIER
jgi:hypothetical protein